MVVNRGIKDKRKRKIAVVFLLLHYPLLIFLNIPY